VILSLDADFLGGIAHPGFLPLAAAYADAASLLCEEGKTMNRMYAVETMPTVTGFKAEHRLALKPSQIAELAQDFVAMSWPAPEGVDEVAGTSFSTIESAEAFLNVLMRDLEASKGSMCCDSG
jgi:hypothetical protein